MKAFLKMSLVLYNGEILSSVLWHWGSCIRLEILSSPNKIITSTVQLQGERNV